MFIYISFKASGVHDSLNIFSIYDTVKNREVIIRYFISRIIDSHEQPAYRPSLFKQARQSANTYSKLSVINQGILMGEVSMHCRPPV